MTAAEGSIAGGGEQLEAPAATLAGEEPAASSSETRAGGEVSPLDIGDPLAGRDIAIEATATLETDDVRAAVDGITAAVTAQGGMVASAAIDYAPDLELGPDARSRATVVIKVPPAALDGIVDRLDALGSVVAFDQLAEDVTEQLTDLGVRIANQRASVRRLRDLLATATDIDAVVRLETALTEREVELERLLAAERNLDERVAMSTLTINVVMTEAEAFDGAAHEFDAEQPGAVEALGRGWDAFVGAAFFVVLVLAAGAPFIVFALALAVAALVVRRTLGAGNVGTGRRLPTNHVTAARPTPDRESVTASRPE